MRKSSSLLTLAVAALIGVSGGTAVAVAASTPAPGYAGSYRYDGIAMAQTQNHYYVATAHGNVIAKNGAKFFGSPVSHKRHLDSPVVGIATSAKVPGYWLVLRNGNVLAYGGAKNYGSLTKSKIKSTSPVVAITATRDGKGYWLITSAGKMYRYGDARLHGTLSASSKNPVVALMTTSDSKGYWVVTANGGVHAYGDAHFLGSLASKHLPAAAVAAATNNGASGYYLVTSRGNIYAFGKAEWRGSAARSKEKSPVTAFAVTRSGNGYWLLRANGDRSSYGKTSNPKPKLPPTSNPLQAGSYGYDVSWPQCGDSTAPVAMGATIIIGVNDGSANTTNPCLAREWAWAKQSPHPWLYVNTNLPDGILDPQEYGEQAAENSLATAKQLGIKSSVWWLDVETTNYWAGPTWDNASMIEGMIQVLEAAHVTVGIYSTSYQWGVITGGAQLSGSYPQWIPGAPADDMASLCSEHFVNGPTWMTQGGSDLDIDYAC